MVINNYISNWSHITSGVPQGSILGPLLFLIFINDITAHVTSNIHLFADDCTIYRKISSQVDIDCLQKDLDAVYYWTQKWQLHLNISKCKAITIRNKRQKIFYV